MPKFKIVTLGCKVNQYESAFLSESLLKKGWERAEKDADLVIINTCIVTQKASHQSRQQIRKAIRENPKAKIVVTGCYAQVYPDELSKIKRINLIISNTEKTKILELIERISPSDSFIVHRRFSKKEKFEQMKICRFEEKTRAFLKIQDGCEAFCTYCIVPYARGPYRSLKPEDVFSSIETFIENGYKEIVLTGIHLGRYGKDLDTDLVTLLKEIGKRNYPVRIRLSSIEPMEITEELLDLIATQDWLCKHLHIPLQSGDNRILKLMKRDYTRKDFYDLIMKIHDMMPFAGIGTDIMVGFPGEDRIAYENTVSLIKDLPISYLHVFPYSDRKGTAAFYFKEKVHPEIVKERARRIREIGRKKKEEFFKRCIGRSFLTLVEGKKEGGYLRGTTDNYIHVLIQSEKDVKNELVMVKLRKIQQDEMIGEI